MEDGSKNRHFRIVDPASRRPGPNGSVGPNGSTARHPHDGPVASGHRATDASMPRIGRHPEYSAAWHSVRASSATSPQISRLWPGGGSSSGTGQATRRNCRRSSCVNITFKNYGADDCSWAGAMRTGAGSGASPATSPPAGIGSPRALRRYFVAVLVLRRAG
jgi:hypothetical protein